jgi:uncharacterized protein
MTEQITISKNIPTEFDLNFDRLRLEGLRHIENLSNKIWTDYNVHDPGITILEMLCYAITDLGYRTSLPFEDLMAEETNNLQAMHEKFHSAINILPVCPLSETDYRKLFIDIFGVKNAWLQIVSPTIYVNCKEKPEGQNDYFGIQSYAPFAATTHKTAYKLQGLFRILIEPDENLWKKESEKDAKIKALIIEVIRTCHRNRNLCEDLVEVNVVDQQKVRICMNIELELEANPNQMHAEIMFRVQNYLTPPVNFYSLDQMLEKGIPVEKIFEGPVLSNGFILDDELEAAGLRKQVRASDIINIIMSIPGIKVIKELYLNFCDAEDKKKEDHQWVLCIKEGFQPALCNDESTLNFYKDVLPVPANKEVAKELLNELYASQKQSGQEISSEDLPMPLGIFRNLQEYSSIQNDFPDNYGINQTGLPDHVSQERKAAAKQLKAYLLFFDQVLANYFVHLSNVKELLSSDDTVKKTYFSQKVKDVKDIEEIVKDYVNAEDNLEDLVRKFDNYHERKNKFLDHLIARFAEKFSDYVFLMRDLYGTGAEDSIIRHKVDFLKDYPVISACRARAMDIFHKEAGIWNTDNVSGLQKRIARLMGMGNYFLRNLSGTYYEFYDEIDEDDIDEHRWRIKNDKGKILLSSSTRYLDLKDAHDELNHAILLGKSIDNYEIKKNKGKNEYYFNVIDETGEVIARRIEYFNSKDGAIKAANEVVEFLSQRFLDDEGMFLIEHILLRPDLDRKNVPPGVFMPVCVEQDCSGCPPLDPYSFRISIILPGWTARFWNYDFRRFIEKMIRLETPAHILPRICWIGQEQMEKFEDVYKRWLEGRFGKPGKQVNDELLKEFIDTLNQLHSIYPGGTLYDCKDGGDENIILDQTNLGTLLKKK